MENRTITATPNHKERTFTIRIKYNGKTSSKYRTVKLSKEEFQSELNNTQNDWNQFLKSSDYYSPMHVPQWRGQPPSSVGARVHTHTR